MTGSRFHKVRSHQRQSPELFLSYVSAVVANMPELRHEAVLLPEKIEGSCQHWHDVGTRQKERVCKTMIEKGADVQRRAENSPG
jgi:hypothetical protein